MKRRQLWLSMLVFAASTSLSVIVGVLMVASHTPFRSEGTDFAKLARVKGGQAGKSWRAIHILAAGCACSRGVAEHLVQRGPVHGLNELVVLVGTDFAMESTLSKAGIQVRRMSAEEAADHYQVNGAPWLVFIAPNGSVRYAGGYSAERNARDGYQDIGIWNALRTGEHADALPAYGCAVGRKLQRRIDPLGLKYGI